MQTIRNNPLQYLVTAELVKALDIVINLAEGNCWTRQILIWKMIPTC